MARPKVELDQDQFEILKKLGAIPFDFDEMGVSLPSARKYELSVDSDEFMNRLVRTYPKFAKRIKHYFNAGRTRTVEVQLLRSRIGTGISNHAKQNGYEHVSMSKQAIEIVLGYKFEELKKSFDAKFTDGNGWHNPKLWHIDHIVPMSMFKFKSFSDPEFLQCWSINNLRPLCAKKNRLKSNHYGDL